jgi:hypothetical protein
MHEQPGLVGIADQAGGLEGVDFGQAWVLR